jgi:hypothetical protein
MAKYPKGITQEIIDGDGVTVYQRILVTETDVYVYQKKVFNWGGITYLRDSTPITESIFEQETKSK